MLWNIYEQSSYEQLCYSTYSPYLKKINKFPNSDIYAVQYAV